MNTQKRLNQAFDRARVEMFDNQSHYIIFSDCHRGDDSVSDEFIKNQTLFLHALAYYDKNGYTYIEAGDGDELWEYKNFRNIRLAHSDVFERLQRFYKKRRFYLIYGNHNGYLKSRRYTRRNYQEYYDEHRQMRVPLFPGIRPCEAVRLIHKETKSCIFVVHGHQGDAMNDQFWFASMLLLRYFWRFLHVVGFQNPASPAKNHYKRHKVEKNYARWLGEHPVLLVCGHTHRAKYPKKRDLPYFNCGSCINSRCITGIEIAEGKIAMVDWRIGADASGRLYVKRTIVRGPDPIEDFRHCVSNFI